VEEVVAKVQPGLYQRGKMSAWNRKDRHEGSAKALPARKSDVPETEGEVEVIEKTQPGLCQRGKMC